MIRNNIEDVRRRIEEAGRRSGRRTNNITLVAVTKGVGIDRINEAVASGITDIGENRVQEALIKYSQLRIPQSTFRTIKWHMVGHLQRNKVKDAVKIFDVIHSVDSIELAEEINKRTDKKIDIFIQVNTSGEGTKFGVSPEVVPGLAKDITSMENLNLKGLMTIAPFVTSLEDARPYFRALNVLKDRINCSDLSMGMSGDFEAAIEEGSTYVRIGTAIFKE